MIVKWTKKKDGKVLNITDAVVSVNWGGSTTQTARTAEITLINAPNDENITRLKLTIAAGDIISLYNENIMIYFGEVQTKEGSSETGTVTYNSIDLLGHLLRSTGVYNFKNTTAEKITRSLCSDFKIETDVITETKATIKKLIVDGDCIYDIIMKAYTKAAKQTGKKYIVSMIGKKLSVKEKGVVVKDFMLAEDSNITKVSFQETIENMVNVVKIYDDKGKQVGEVKNLKQVETYGIYQQIYKKEKGVDATKAAISILVGLENKVSIEGIEGDINCIAGNGVKVRDTATKLNGLFWIDSDNHTWENGIHTMSLELNFKNIMDSKEE